ncbi:UGT-62 protein [Aphelenchoides avenae]|nr:UGT-62 protein [Aphelenchus avenae]KAH7717114.1 UGT-62 protein [Aphelenchus avenae]
MIAKKPLSPDERILKYTEMAAEFDVAENLDIYGRRLNFFQYYSLDVILPILIVLALVAIAMAFGLYKCCGCVAKAVRKRRYEKVE